MCDLGVRPARGGGGRDAPLGGRECIGAAENRPAGPGAGAEQLAVSAFRPPGRAAAVRELEPFAQWRASVAWMTVASHGDPSISSRDRLGDALTLDTSGEPAVVAVKDTIATTEANRAGSGQAHRMRAARSIDVSIQIDVDAEPIAGHLRYGSGRPRPFRGWLELASAIEDALATANQHSAVAEAPELRRRRTQSED